MKIKCAVVCTEASGSPTIVFYTITVSQKGYDLGNHYDKAKERAMNDGYEDPMIVLDENEGPGWLWIAEAKLRKNRAHGSIVEHLAKKYGGKVTSNSTALRSFL